MKKRNLKIDQRERDTIIAALRYWQEGISDPYGTRVSRDLWEIAENGRTGDEAFLAPSEIDELIEERVNV
jgi:hypothetical protein